MNIFLQIKKTLESNLPFVVYNKPNTTTIKGFFQNNNELYTSKEYNESGFIFAPFNDSDSSIVIPENQSLFIQEKINLDNCSIINNNFDIDSSSKQNHIELVQKGIDAIKNVLFKKVVLSRKEKVEVPNLNIVETFKRLLINYPTAFVYLWFHPKVGMWLGATPETLIKIKDNEFLTMSLAGTQIFKDTTKVTWQPKEIEEQQFVTDYITEKLSNICNTVNISETETIKAGNLLHLRTIISGQKKVNNATLIKTLHPTPAVCGLPLEPSKDFILKHENYNREFYTGFLGELNLQNKGTKTSELFVNLRCMKVENNTASVFIGGGITKDSNPEKEWKETIAKSNTMKNIL